MLTGPGLQGLPDRLPKPSEEWFIKWVLNSEKVLKSGDPYARKIYEVNGRASMTVFEGYLTKQDVRAIYSYLTEPKF